MRKILVVEVVISCQTVWQDAVKGLTTSNSAIMLTEFELY